MGYELRFRLLARGLTLQAFEAYFQARQNYELVRSQAYYSNETTGVYFSFDYEGESSSFPVSFALSYFRPHIFGLEAEAEVAALAKHFGLLVSDPQKGGMGEGGYSREGFLAGWNQGNELAYRAFLAGRRNREGPLSLPTELIEKYWKWNLDRDEFQSELGEDIFVPRIMFFEVDGRLCSTVVWPNAIPAAIPEVDLLFILRGETASCGAKPDNALLPRENAMEWLSQYPERCRNLRYRLLDYPEAPPAIRGFIRRLRRFNGSAQKIDTDQILNMELVDKYMRGSRQ